MPRKTKKKSKKKSVKRENRVVHQIYGIFDDGIPLKDIPVFYENVQATKKFCKKEGYQYKMWNLATCVKVIKTYYPEYLSLWNAFPLPIQRADFVRYCILYKYGGIYVDCDIHPLRSLNDLFQKDYFFVTWHNDTKKLPYNAVMGSQKGESIFVEIMKHCEESFKKASKQKIYKTWKGRFVFQTTGHRMLDRVLKKEKVNKKKYVLDILRVKSKDGKIITARNPYFEDSNASVWFDKK